MRFKILILAIFCFVINSNIHAENHSGYKIQISAPSYKGSTVYFANYWAGNPYIKDSLQFDKKGVAIFEGKETLPTGQYLLYIDNSLRLELLIDEKEQSDIKIELAKKDISKSKINGSKDTQLLWEYITNQQKNKEQNNILDKNKGTWFTQFVHANQPIKVPHSEPENNQQAHENRSYVQEHYFDRIDFTDERLWRTSFFVPMVNNYLEEWIPQHPDTIAARSSWIVSQTKANEFCFENMLSTLVNQATTSKVMGMENVWAKLAEDYIFDKNISWIDSTQYSNLKRDYSLIELNRLGMPAQNLNLVTIEGDSINTNDIEAELLLLYFYSPDCSYCQEETKKLVNELFPKYKDSGLKIVAINLVHNLDKWQNYIEQKQMTEWINAADPNFSSQYWLKYDVSGTPSIYLLNRDKVIIAKKLDVENLIKYIERF